MSESFANPLPAGFNRLAGSNLAAQSAEQIALAAMPMVAVLALHADASTASWLQVALTLPFVLFAIPIGMLADRWPKRALMASAEAVRAMALLAVAGLLAAGLLNLPMLGLLGFVAVCGTVVFSVAAPALVPSLVPSAMLSRANGRIELARTVAFACGPAIGGALIGWTGATVAFLLAAGLSAVAAVLLRGVASPAPVAGRASHPLQDIAEGARFVFRHPLLRPVFATQFIFTTAIFMVFAIFVPYAAHRLGLSAQAIGFTLAMYGAGMVVGALLAARILARWRFGHVVATGPVCGLAGGVLLAATLWQPWPALAHAGFFLLGCGPILWVVSTTTLRQTVTPPALLARVSAVNVMSYGARPLGAALAAWLAAQAGMGACLVAALAGFALQLLCILQSPAVRLVRQPTAADADMAFGPTRGEPA
ncbi:MFS transporter [Ralstonia mannitolilytica]|uniref:Enterobactin exporter EntS n=1 Tax=Ralstonia mannitolilytica TaxID=105219 RepID=A0AAD2B160_9RALS|nr:MFS transporter [Ralstonia mannitolilytica]MBY4721415.1 MFS transporter [Ralstonia mannitolilytica]CAJ0697928.1 Enterobactin exporter EntS [Ralstonia mannitolilytica]CAJ0888713.1 Enterobactin exporter EntS [Ralstonia mannitolilytica]